MLSYLEYTLNKSIKDGRKPMTLNEILSHVDKKSKKFTMNPNNYTIHYVDENEYNSELFKYIEPEFNLVCEKNDNTRYIIFSAPGATGKSALAKYLSYSLNGVYWNLPDNKIAEYSFQGAISEAVGYLALSEFMHSLQTEESLLIIDAFDNAEASSGRNNIEFFLRDLDSVIKDCKNPCAILMARTDSAVFIKQYFEKHDINYAHYEVGYFAEDNSKLYIKNKLECKNVQVTPVIEKCMNEQFKEIHTIFNDKEAKAFLGYAPVLDALAQTYVENQSTIALLKDTSSGENNCKVMVSIFKSLLERERGKFIKALKVKLIDEEVTINYDNVYKEDEQLKRIIGNLLFNEHDFFYSLEDVIPAEYIDDYIKVVDIQLPQHPFINKRSDSSDYDFTGPAFRDYAIAFSLADDDMHDFVKDLLLTECNYYPSQMLIEFYEVFSNGKISGKDISLMYDSFRAHAHVGENVTLRVSGDSDECYVEFILNNKQNVVYSLSFEVIDLENGIHFSQANNCYIDVDGDVYIDNYKGEARISNSEIICNTLLWNSDHVLIESFSPGICSIIANEFKSITTSTRFDLNFDKAANVRLFANNINSYYKLLAYKMKPVDENCENEFIFFTTVVRRIFSCLRSHSKDTPARKMDFIDNKIIGKIKSKEMILTFLLNAGILYTDRQDWLYKLNTNKLGESSIRWNNVTNGELESLTKLYNSFVAITKIEV